MATESAQLIVEAINLLRTTIGASGATANQVQGNVAANVADTGNPVKIGGKVSTGPAATPIGRRVDAWLGAFGEQVVSLGGAAGIGDGGNAWQLAQSVVDGIGRPLAVIPAYYDGVNVRYGRGDVNGAAVVAKGGSSIATGQVNLTAANGTLIVAARAGRQKVTITPTSATVFYVGAAAGVTAGTGLYVAAGASITLDTAAAIYGIGAAAVTVTYIEFY